MPPFRLRLRRPRTHRGRLLSGVAALVLVAGLGYGAFAVLAGGSSPPALALSQRATTGQSGGAPTLSSVAGTWAVGSGSVAGYRVHERLAVLPAASDAVGRTSSVTGQATITDAGTAHIISGASFTVQVNTLASDRAMRDQRVHTMGLETDTYPTATFTLSQPITLPEAAGGGQGVAVTATGPLTLHGVTRTASIPLSVRLSGTVFEVVGSLSFPWSEFGMSAPNFGHFVTVADTATMELDLHLSHTA